MNKLNREQSNVNKETLQLLYNQLKTKELELYQEIQELKNLNPFKVSNFAEFENDRKDKYTNLDDFHKKGYTHKKKVNYNSLLNKLEMIVEQISKDVKSTNTNIGQKTVPYEIVMNVEVEFLDNEPVIELENINWYVNRKERREEIQDKMTNKTELDDFYEHEHSRGFYHDDNIFHTKDDKETPYEQLNEADSNDEMEALKRELAEIKELLQHEKGNEMNEPSSLEPSSEDEVSLYKKVRKITFRDIQKAENIQSIPSKKLKTITKINRYKKPDAIIQKDEKEAEKRQKQVIKKPTNPTQKYENIIRKK